MDFDDIFAQVGSFGRYQKLVLFLVLFPATLPCGFFGWNQVFMSGTPHEYHCKLPLANLTSAQTIKLLPVAIGSDGKPGHDKCHMYDLNYDSLDVSLLSSDTYNLSDWSKNLSDYAYPIVPCMFGWEYNHSDWTSTIVTEWDLVCDKELYVPHAYTISSVGGLVGMVYLGFVADRYGRVACYFLNFALMMAASIATIFSPNFIWFCVFRFFVGTSGWAYTLPLIVAMEIIGPEQRASMTVWCSFFYTAGFLLIGLLSYLVSAWRLYALVSISPLVLIIGYWWLMPESPRWLLSQKRYEDLTLFFRKVARINGKDLDPEFSAKLPSILQMIDEKSHNELDEKVNRRYSMRDLFRCKNLRKKTLILCFVNTCNLGVYVGLTIYGPTLNVNPHWNFFLSGLAEMPGYLVTSFFCDRFGRRLTMVSTMVLAGAAGLAAAAVPDSSVGIMTGLIFVSKFGISIAFVVSELLEDELFPTVVRAEGHSATAFVSNIFTLEVSYIVFLGHEYLSLPLIIFGGVCMFAAGAGLFLPETANTDLPQTLEDGEEFGKHMPWKDILSFRVPPKRKYLDAGSLFEIKPINPQVRERRANRNSRSEEKE